MIVKFSPEMESISKLSLNECFNSDVDLDFLKKSQAQN